VSHWTEFESRLIEEDLAIEPTIRGCTLAQVAEVEARHGHPLPSEYREYLMAMGLEAGEFLRGSHAFYPEILELNDWTIEALAEGGLTFDFKTTEFVFLNHGGYLAYYFDTADGADPPVWFFRESNPQGEQVADSFTAMMDQLFADSVAAKRALDSNG